MKDPTLKAIEKWCGASKYKDDVVAFVLLMVCLFGFAFFGYLVYFIITSF
jgi:hypothetical protein